MQVLLMSDFKRPYATFEYIDRYLYGVSESGQEKFNLATFYASLTHLMNFNDIENEEESK